MTAKPRYRATRLADVLSAQGRKQRWLAEQLGVHESFVSRIIAGERTADAGLVNRIGAALAVPPFLLFELPESNESMPIGKESAA